MAEIFSYFPNTNALASYSIIDIKNAIIGNDKEGMEEPLRIRRGIILRIF
ncbi:MAG TPA: hypothetical protein PKW84_05070 [Fervidobacterium sp.]|nr:hypothetical protein [Fervidobacterium sp.]